MSNQSMKTERFELRLRANIPAEAALLAELDAQNGVYGGKTELLRECLRRGFTALGAAVDAQPAQATEKDILDALASQFPTGAYSYRIGKLFIDAKAAVAKAVENPVPLRGEPVVDAPGSSPVAPVALAAPDPVPVSPSSAQQTSQESHPEEPRAARPAADWARLRRIAGSGDGGSDGE